MFQDLCDWKRKTLPNSQQHVPLLERCGVLMVSDRIAEDGTYEFIERCQNSAAAYDIPVELLNSDQMRKKFGNAFRIKDNMAGLLEPEAGFVRPELALQYAIENAVEKGAKIVENSEVISINKLCDPDEGLICIKTSTGETYTARKVLVSAGAWTSKLLPEWDRYLTVTRQIQAWFEPKDQKYHPSTCPGWFLDRSRVGLGVYGVPADPSSFHKSNWVKVALHGRNIKFDPDGPRPQVSKEEIEEICNAVEDWIPEAAQHMVSTKACLYTMSPDGDFIVDCVPGFRDFGNVWCVAGLSGHGFKMTPVLGKAAADILLHGKTDLPIDFLSADRLY